VPVEPASIYARIKNLSQQPARTCDYPWYRREGRRVVPSGFTRTRHTTPANKRDNLARPVFRIIYPPRNEGRKKEAEFFAGTAAGSYRNNRIKCRFSRSSPRLLFFLLTLADLERRKRVVCSGRASLCAGRWFVDDRCTIHSRYLSFFHSLFLSWIFEMCWDGGNRGCAFPRKPPREENVDRPFAYICVTTKEKIVAFNLMRCIRNGR